MAKEGGFDGFHHAEFGHYISLCLLDSCSTEFLPNRGLALTERGIVD